MEIPEVGSFGRVPTPMVDTRRCKTPLHVHPSLERQYLLRHHAAQHSAVAGMCITANGVGRLLCNQGKLQPPRYSPCMWLREEVWEHGRQAGVLYLVFTEKRSMNSDTRRDLTTPPATIQDNPSAVEIDTEASGYKEKH